MSIAAEITETVYQLTGANLGPFLTGWTYVQPTDVTLLIDPGTGVLQPLELNTDFTLYGLAPTVAGGTVNLSNSLLGGLPAWPTGAALYLVRNSTTATDTSWGSSGDFDPETAAQSIDDVMRKVQEIGAEAGRALVVRPGEAGVTLPPLAERRGQFAAFDPVTGAVIAVESGAPGAGEGQGNVSTSGQPTDIPILAPGSFALRADYSTVGAAAILWVYFAGAANWVPVAGVAP